MPAPYVGTPPFPHHIKFSCSGKDICIYVPCSPKDTLVNPHVSVKYLADNKHSCVYTIIRSTKQVGVKLVWG
jgi:hypothetical protein